MEKMALDVNKMTKDQLRQHVLMLAMELTQLEKKNEKLQEKVNTYSEEYGKLREENRKLKNLKICGKTVEERIEIDKGVVRDKD